MRTLKSHRLEEVQRFTRTDVSTPHMVASAAVLRAYKILSQRVEAALAPLDLNIARFEVLGLLNDAPDGRMSFGDLTRVTLLNSSTMTYTIDGLEKSDLIQRRRHPSDRRVVLVEITARGRELANEATERLNDIKFGLADLAGGKADRVATLLSELRDPR